MTDSELLELAAKSAGIEPATFEGKDVGWHVPGRGVGNWNPLDNDGDALRLAVKLGLRIFTPDGEPTAVCDRYPNGPRAGVDVFTDKYSAVRRAIVRAAAEIGKSMAA